MIERLNERRVLGAALHQRAVVSLVDDAPAFHEDDLPAAAEELQLVRHEQHRLAAQFVADAALEDVLADLRVHGAQRVIQQVYIPETNSNSTGRG